MISITKNIQSNELLRYASYLAIAKFKMKKGRSPSGLYFNKIMSLSHKTMKDKGINIGLPHYWYRYGDQVFKPGMPNDLLWNHESPFKTTVEWESEKPFSYDDNTYKLIEKTIDDLTEKYAGRNKQIIQEVYQYAPFNFQRSVLDLRRIVYGWKNALNWDSKSYKTVSKKIILNSLSTFPERDFSELNEQYKVFRDLIETIVEKHNWDFNLFEWTYITFWFWFCYYLRLKKEARENIPKETVSYWEGKLEFENSRYRRIMGDIIIFTKEDHPKIKENKLLMEEYDWRVKDLKEAKNLIDELDLT